MTGNEKRAPLRVSLAEHVAVHGNGIQVAEFDFFIVRILEN